MRGSLPQAVRYGVPPTVRPRLWCRLTNVASRMRATDGRGRTLYGDFLSLGSSRRTLFQRAAAEDVQSLGLGAGGGTQPPSAHTVLRLLTAFECWFASARAPVQVGVSSTHPLPSSDARSTTTSGMVDGRSGADGSGLDAAGAVIVGAQSGLVYSPALRSLAAVLARTADDEAEAFWMMTWLSDRLMLEHHTLHRVGLEVREL
jgi:hypothetical protein